MTTAASKSRYGVFRDSLKAPIHGWFTYPAGYSYKLVEAKFDEHGIRKGDLVADPFLGTGTTSLVAKMRPVDSLGIEAHPYVHEVACTKLDWAVDAHKLAALSLDIIAEAHVLKRSMNEVPKYPDLVYKCFTPRDLLDLSAIKSSIANNSPDLRMQRFFELGLAATLRLVTTAGAGWPYIAPSKRSQRKSSHNPFEKFAETINSMIADLIYVSSLRIPASHQDIRLGDAKKIDFFAEHESIDLIVTSPPYLNNYDYADRTRLETYFLGKYESWADISREVRSRLMVSATTQITLRDMQHLTELPTLKRVSSSAYQYLRPRVDQLFELRNEKSGRKTYDILVAGYFEDMTKILASCFRTLRKGSAFVLVIGDSAPYGVHVETEYVLGELAMDVGFKGYSCEVIRTRGEKWPGNSQRHNVKLKESILTIIK